MEKHCVIVIPIHNRLDCLQECVASILKHTLSSYTLVLVDDGSKEDVGYFHQKVVPSAIYIRNESPVGFTYAVNQGIEAVKGDYYCLLNSDAKIMTSNWLREMITVGEEDSAIGILGPVSNNASGQSIPWRGDHDLELLEMFSEKRVRRIGFVSGFCYLFKQEVLDRVGLLDQVIFPHYASEDDFTLRIRKAGFVAVVVDWVFVHHRGSSSYDSQRVRLGRWGFCELQQKWGEETIQNQVNTSARVLDDLRYRINAWIGLTEFFQKQNKILSINSIIS